MHLLTADALTIARIHKYNARRAPTFVKYRIVSLIGGNSTLNFS